MNHLNPSTTIGDDCEIVHSGNQEEDWIHVYSAHKLYTPRKINNVYFDGTKDITISAYDVGISYKTTTLALQNLSDVDLDIFSKDALVHILNAFDEENVVKRGLLRSYIVTEENPDYTYLHDRCFIIDIAMLICGLVANEDQTLAEKYVQGLLECYYTDGSIPHSVSAIHGLVPTTIPAVPATPTMPYIPEIPATNRCLRTETSVLAMYALLYFKSKYPSSSLANSIDTKVSLALSALETFYDANTNSFIQGKGKYSPTYATFDPDFVYTDHMLVDNIFAYYMYSLAGNVARATALQTTLLDSFWDTPSRNFKISLESDEQTVYTASYGAMFLKSIAHPEAAHTLGLVENYYSTVSDPECVAQAAGYKERLDSIGISSYATLTVALARLSFRQFNRALSDLVSMSNMFNIDTGILQYNKESLVNAEYTLYNLNSVVMLLTILKPKDIFLINCSLDEAGMPDAVHIHNVEEIRGIGSALADIEAEVQDVSAGLTVLDTDLHTNYYTKTELYTKNETDALLAKKAPLGYYVAIDPTIGGCTAGQVLAAGVNGYILADCRSLSTMQGLAYALENSVDNVVYVSMYGDVPTTGGVAGKPLYLGYDGNTTTIPTEYGNEWVKAIGIVVGTDKLILNFDSIAAKVYMLPDSSNARP